MPFVEALTQFRYKVGKGNLVNIHVSYVPIIHGEEKTKPTQHAIKQMRSAGLIPDLVSTKMGYYVILATKSIYRLLAAASVLSTKLRLKRLPEAARSNSNRLLPFGISRLFIKYHYSLRTRACFTVYARP